MSVETIYSLLNKVYLKTGGGSTLPLATLDQAVVNANPGNYVRILWSDEPHTKAQLDASQGRPYVRVDELFESASNRMYGHVETMSRLVDMQIHQGQNANGSAPDKAMATAVYMLLQGEVPQRVNMHTYSDPLVLIYRTMGLSPTHDERTGGLFGMIRFNLVLPRG